ncbi:MAG: serine/threonine protein kinase [Acidimicrobiia bacterium]|nr:serine/threonine protein kinase [Acidimicrobiia bacterium]
MLAPGTVIGGRYRLVESIASGGMADVYEAQDERLGRAVAIKVLRASDPGLSRRFADEVRTLARLNDPGVVALYDADEYEGHAFFVMELVRGRSLADLLAEGPLEPRRAATIAASITKGLAQAHGAGIIHRDVKPANIMVTGDGSAKLADFGIARMTGSQSDLTQAGTVIGTAAYLSPEQAEGKEISPATDIYSLGLVLIEALTAKRVFEGTATEAVVARLTRDPEIPQGLPGNWGEILAAMTSRDPLSRPFAETLSPMFAALAADETVAMAPDAGATEALGVAAGVAAGGAGAAATEVLGAGSTGAEVAPPAPDHDTDRRRRNIAIAIAVLVGVLLVGGIAYAITSGSSTTTTTTTTEATTTVAPETTTTVHETTTTERPTTTKSTTTTTKPATTTSRTTTTTKSTTTTSTTKSPPTTN